MIEMIRDLFDLGVEISLGDDFIVVTGRDFNGEDENSYIETMYEFEKHWDISDIYDSIKEKRSRI